MRKKVMFVITMLMLLVFAPKVEACVYNYEEYNKLGIQQSFVVGDYVFNVDSGYSPSLEDFAIAARSIPEDQDEYIYNILNINMGNSTYFMSTEVFSGVSTTNKAGFPKIDVTYEYWNNITGASNKDYKMYTCKVSAKQIGITYTTLETVGEGEYKTSATRTVQITSDAKIKEVYYCLTSAEECTPETKATLNKDKTISVNYDTNIAGQRVCTKAIDEYGNYTEVVCDDLTVKVDKLSASVKATESLGTIIEREPNPLDELFEITYSVSGGEVIYYYYVEENGEEIKNLLTDMSDLPEGNIKVEAKAIAGNGLVTTEQRVIEVKNHTVTYDYKTNGGTRSDIEEYKVAYKGKAKLTSVAYKDGYEFIGWNTDANATIGLEKVEVDSDITLYAIFKGNITSKFEVKTKDGSVPATIEYEEYTCEVYNNEDECEVAIPTLNAKVGYEALGWSSKEYDKEVEYVGGETIVLKGNKTYYSVTRNKIATTGTFNYYDGETKKPAVEVLKCYLYNGDTSCAVDPSGITSDDFEGRKVIGFSKSKEVLTPETNFELTSGAEYYAYYKDEYTITYVSGKGVSKTDKAEVQFVVDNTGIEEKVEERTVQSPESISGWTFIGYRSDAELGEAEVTTGDKIKVEKDTTYNAMYKKDITVSYSLDSDVKNGPTSSKGTINYLSANKTETKYKYTFPEIGTMTKTGYKFKSWKVGETEYDPGESIMINANTTVGANWTLDGCIVYFDYETNGGSSASKTSVTYINGDEPIDVSGITAYKQGWTFIGWTDKSPETTTNPLSRYEPTDTSTDKTLYAMFKKTIIVDYRIQDVLNFTTTTNDREEYTIYNSATYAEVEMPEATTTSNLYKFIGWNRKADSTAAEYKAGEKAKLSEYTVMYTITSTTSPLVATYHYMEDGAGAIDESRCYLYNGAKTCVVKPGIEESTYNGGVLGGWSSSATEIKETSTHEISKNTDYYGYYDTIVTVTYYSGMNKASKIESTNALKMIASPSGVTLVKPSVIIETPDGISGYTTLGWRDDETAESAEYKAKDTLTLESDKTLYGVYNKNITISYAPNGGSSTPASETKVLGYNTVQDPDGVTVEFTLANGITREGYTFKGWSAENSGPTLTSGSKTKLSKSTKMYAVWELNSYKVTYDYGTNGGSSVTTGNKTTAYNTQVDLTPTAYKAGYEFVGWSESGTSTKVVDTLTMPAKNITLYAVFRKPLVATWVLTDKASATLGSSTTQCYIYNNATSCKANTPTVTLTSGYAITGWTSTQGNTTVEVANNGTATLTGAKTYYSISRNATPITGTFYYPITVVEDSGDDTEETEGTVEITSKQVQCYKYNGASTCRIQAPITPTGYKGAIFNQWSHSETSLVNVSYELSENKNYYSNFVKIIEIIYHDNSNDIKIIDTDSATYTLSSAGDHEYLPTFTIRTPTEFSDYKQIGWTEDAENIVGTITFVPGTKVTDGNSYELYGQYQRTLKLTYDANNGATTPATQTATQTYHSYLGQTVHQFKLSAAIARTGYTFQNWRTNSLSGTAVAASSNVTIEEHTKYIAEWKANTYNITYDYVNGTKGTSNPATATYDQEINISNPGKTVRITGNENGTGATIGTATSKQQTFAGWTFNGDVSTALYGDSGSVTTKWTSQSTKVTKSYFKNLNPTNGSTVKLTANWTPVSFKLPTATKTGYTCTFNTKADGTGTSYASGGTYTPTANSAANITLYAICKANTYKVVYHGNGNTSGSTATSTHTYDTAKNLTKNGFVKTGYTFQGWSDSSTGSVLYTDQKSVTNLATAQDAEVDVYAIWKANTYTITFNGNGGTPSFTSSTVTYDGAFGTLPTATYAHNEFLGWYTAATGGTKVETTTKVQVTANTTLYAHWQTIKAPVLTGGSIDYSNKRTITIGTAGSANSGVSHYEYYVSTSSTAPTASTAATGTTTGSYIFNTNGNYYIWYRTVANSGLKSAWSANQYVRIDIDKPEADLRTEDIDGYKYLVFDTYDTISGIDRLEDENGNILPSREIALKIWVNGYTNSDQNDGYDYVQLMKDLGYTDYNITYGTYPTVAELKAAGYNTFVDNKFVWAPNTIVNEYFANGINLVTVGNDSTSALTPIASNSGTTAGSEFLPAVQNIFTKKLGDLNNGTNKTDSRQTIKFVSGTEILYKEVFDDGSAVNDAIGYYTANGAKWIHSQLALTTSLLPVVDTSLSYISNKGLYYYKLETEGTHKFKLYDKAGNVKDIEYTYGRSTPTLSATNSKVETVYTRTNGTNTITYNGDGDLSVSSSNTSVATVSISGKTITVTPGSSYGTATITVNASQGASYKAASTTFTVQNRLVPTLTIGDVQINKKTLSIAYSYNGDGAETSRVGTTSLATITSHNTASNVVYVQALNLGQTAIYVETAQTDKYVAASVSKTFVFGSATSSNSTAFQNALTDWATIGPATNQNWYGSTTDGYNSAGTYTIIETVNTNEITAFYYVEKDANGNRVIPQYEDMMLDVDITSTDGDDDFLGFMWKFNPEATTNYASGYILWLNNGASGWDNSANSYGLWRMNNNLFGYYKLLEKTNATPLVQDNSIRWARNKWQHYRVQHIDNTITIWRWDTNDTGVYETTDDAIIYQYTDTSANAIKSGTYGFWTLSQPYAQFKNFSVITGDPNDFEITVN